MKFPLFASLLCLCLLASPAFSQFDKVYTPVALQDTVPPKIHAAIQARLERNKAGVQHPDKRVVTYARKLYDERAATVESHFNDDFLIVDGPTPYLQSVLERIYAANPALPREASVYAYRSEVPNAMSFGEGTIGFTLGLLQRMETEAQLAYVLCHELAHLHTRHADTATLRVAQLKYDKEIAKKVREIEKNDYKKYTKYSKLATTLAVSITRHGRDKEFEADSVGLQYYLHTDYDLTAPVRVLEILEKADLAYDSTALDLKSTFTFPTYPFKDQWLTYERSTRWYASDDTADSLRTHPSCDKRLVAIKRQLATAPTGGSRKPADYQRTRIQELRTVAQFEIAASAYHYRDYGRCLFNSLLLARQYPENTYVQGLIGQSLYKLYQYQKAHDLGRVLSTPFARYPENYDRYLTFLHGLRLMELASITYHYTATQTAKYPTSDDLLYAYYLACNTEVSQQDATAVKADYLKRFPDGRYRAQLK
jgi:predicted Zn-dependent protease